jgi:hypothetical protein
LDAIEVIRLYLRPSLGGACRGDDDDGRGRDRENQPLSSIGSENWNRVSLYAEFSRSYGAYFSPFGLEFPWNRTYKRHSTTSLLRNDLPLKRTDITAYRSFAAHSGKRFY